MEHAVDGIFQAFFCVLGLVTVLLVFYCFWGAGRNQGIEQENERWKEELIKRGLAKYACDPDTGVVDFVWEEVSGDAR